MKLFTGIVQKQIVFITLAMFLWEMMVVLLGWGNTSGGIYGPLMNNVFLVFGLLLALIKIKNFEKRMAVTFGVMLVNSLFILLLISFTYTLGTILLYHLVIPDYVQTLVQEKMNLMLADSSVSEEKIQSEIAAIHQRFSIEGLLIKNFVVTLGTGMISSLVLSGVFSQKSVA